MTHECFVLSNYNFMLNIIRHSTILQIFLIKIVFLEGRTSTCSWKREIRFFQMNEVINLSKAYRRTYVRIYPTKLSLLVSDSTLGLCILVVVQHVCTYIPKTDYWATSHLVLDINVASYLRLQHSDNVIIKLW